MLAEYGYHHDIFSRFHSKVTPEIVKKVQSGDKKTDEVLEAGFIASGWDSIVFRVDDYVVKVIDSQYKPRYKREILRMYEEVTNKLADITQNENVFVETDFSSLYPIPTQIRVMVNPILWLGYDRRLKYHVSMSPFIKGDQVGTYIDDLVHSTLVMDWHKKLGITGIDITPINMKFKNNTPNLAIITDLCVYMSSLKRTPSIV